MPDSIEAIRKDIKTGFPGAAFSFTTFLRSPSKVAWSRHSRPKAIAAKLKAADQTQERGAELVAIEAARKNPLP